MKYHSPDNSNKKVIPHRLALAKKNVRNKITTQYNHLTLLSHEWDFIKNKCQKDTFGSFTKTYDLKHTTQQNFDANSKLFPKSSSKVTKYSQRLPNLNLSTTLGWTNIDTIHNTDVHHHLTAEFNTIKLGEYIKDNYPNTTRSNDMDQRVNKELLKLQERVLKQDELDNLLKKHHKKVNNGKEGDYNFLNGLANVTYDEKSLFQHFQPKLVSLENHFQYKLQFPEAKVMGLTRNIHDQSIIQQSPTPKRSKIGDGLLYHKSIEISKARNKQQYPPVENQVYKLKVSNSPDFKNQLISQCLNNQKGIDADYIFESYGQDLSIKQTNMLKAHQQRAQLTKIKNTRLIDLVNNSLQIRPSEINQIKKTQKRNQQAKPVRYI